MITTEHVKRLQTEWKTVIEWQNMNAGQ